MDSKSFEVLIRYELKKLKKLVLYAYRTASCIDATDHNKSKWNDMDSERIN